MKLAVPLVMLWSLFALALFGCDEPISHERERVSSPSAAEDDAPAQGSSHWADAIRSRAEAAHADAAHRAEADRPTPTASTRRSQSRVGPQPWPQDLPDAWPRFASATVVADTQQSGGERLLLVDWPGAPENAQGVIQRALLDRGYRVERPELRRRARALHAEAADHEAVLTFHAREQVTRVEILILARATG